MGCKNSKLNSDYKNPNGIMTYEEIWNIKKMSEYEKELFHKNFRIVSSKCPPAKLRPPGNLCFHCKECFEHAIKKVKKKML